METARKLYKSACPILKMKSHWNTARCAPSWLSAARGWLLFPLLLLLRAPGGPPLFTNCEMCSVLQRANNPLWIRRKQKQKWVGLLYTLILYLFFFKLSYYFFKQNLECRLAGKDSPGWDDCRMPKALLPLPPSGLLRPFQKALGPCWEGTVDSNDLPEES